ncbi:hypothetical protein BH11ARM2_BH11ARM2_23210 [soil metagenome]
MKALYDDLPATPRGVARILRTSGWLVATITHPCFQSPPGRDYFEEGFWRSDNPHGVRGQVGAHHRILSTYLSTYLSTLGATGLLVERADEPRLPGRDLPPVLVFQCRRAH